MTLIFGVFVLLIGFRMLTAKPVETSEWSPEQIRKCFILGLPLGVLSGILGVAGGGVMIPLMVLVLKFTMHQAVATSMLVMVFNSAGGALSFMVNGIGVEGLPPFSTGYINWLHWLLLAGCSIPMAVVGARTAHRLPAKRVRQIFVLVMFYIGLKMAGFLDWISLLG
jgi:uncharacterized membrane protein YfcA